MISIKNIIQTSFLALGRMILGRLSVKGQTSTWNGSVSSDWNYATNWSNGVSTAEVIANIQYFTKSVGSFFNLNHSTLVSYQNRIVKQNLFSLDFSYPSLILNSLCCILVLGSKYHVKLKDIKIGVN